MAQTAYRFCRALPKTGQLDVPQEDIALAAAAKETAETAAPVTSNFQLVTHEQSVILVPFLSHLRNQFARNIGASDLTRGGGSIHPLARGRDVPHIFQFARTSHNLFRCVTVTVVSQVTAFVVRSRVIVCCWSICGHVRSQ